MKKVLFSCVIIFLIIYSFFFPEIIVNSARNGLQIWFNQILPTLLPFSILCSVLTGSSFLKSFKGTANLYACLTTLVCGFVFGFPVGAKLSADFYREKLITKKQASILSVTTNNFSPMYVCGFALPLLFSSTKFNIITYLLLYLFPLFLTTICLILETRKTPMSKEKANSHSFELNMKIMDYGILNSFKILVKICGYIVSFSIFVEILFHTISIFKLNMPLVISILLGNLEISNGIHLLSQMNVEESIKYIFAIQFLSFGGISGIAQTGSILSEMGLSTYKYIIGKAVLSLLITFLTILYVFSIHSL